MIVLKRWALRILVFLLLGAIVNVAVAWGCATWSGRALAIDSITRGDLDKLLGWWSERFPGHDPQSSESANYVRIDEASAFGLRGRNMSHGPLRVICLWSGWPCLSMTGECRQRAAVNQQLALIPNVPPETHDDTLIRVESLLQTNSDIWWNVFDRFWPLRPIWPGFAINTVFYAALLWLLFAGPFVLRRRRRIRRGLCTKCAYDLRGTRGGPDATACPECGAHFNFS